MQWMLDNLRFLSVVLIGAFVLEMTPAEIALAGDEVHVQNIRMTRTASQIVVLYDLIGTCEKYSVTITLKRKGEALFRYSPKNVSGDCGEEVTSGIDKRIAWDYQREFPMGLPGDDYSVVVEVEVETSGISPFVWIGGGVALAGAMALLLLTRKRDAVQSSPDNSGFPVEPARP